MAVEVLAALAAASGLGAPLAEAARFVLERRRNRRLAGFLWRLGHDLGRLEDRIDDAHEFFQSEDYLDLVEDVVSRAEDCRREQKLDAYRAIFLNTVVDEPAYDEGAEILEIVARWQPYHLAALRMGDKEGRRGLGGREYVPSGAGKIPISPDRFLAVLGRQLDEVAGWSAAGRGARVLRRFIDDGLLSLDMELRGAGTYGGRVNAESRLRATPLAQRVLDYLQNPTEEGAVESNGARSTQDLTRGERT